ncbi:MAG: DUF503 domain-containing protein [Candidatus Omnitrophota bacterium]
MRIGILELAVEIPGSASLKDKRSALKSVKDMIRKSFNVSVSEVDHHDKWQLSTLGVAIVSNDVKFIDSTLNRIVDLVERQAALLVLDVRTEVI